MFVRITSIDFIFCWKHRRRLNTTNDVKWQQTWRSISWSKQIEITLTSKIFISFIYFYYLNTFVMNTNTSNEYNKFITTILIYRSNFVYLFKSFSLFNTLEYSIKHWRWLHDRYSQIFHCKKQQEIYKKIVPQIVLNYVWLCFIFFFISIAKHYFIYKKIIKYICKSRKNDKLIVDGLR